MSEILLYSNSPMAVPAFRLLLFVRAELNDPPLRSAFAKIYARFEADYGEAARVAAYHFDKHEGDFKHMKPELLEAGRVFFDREKTKFGDGLRRYGMMPEEFDNPALPFFCAEQYRAFTLLELALPPEAQANVASADAIMKEIEHLPVICGLMGFGFFLPPYKNSLAFMLGQASQRYRAAIEITAKMVDQGIQREGSYYRWKPNEEPGIADIGWRTLVGKDFIDRLPRPGPEADGISVEARSNMVVFTVGQRPIWGDVNKGEDMGGYKMVAARLKPVRFPEGVASIAMFGGDNPDRVKAYLGRLD